MNAPCADNVTQPTLAFGAKSGRARVSAPSAGQNAMPARKRLPNSTWRKRLDIGIAAILDSVAVTPKKKLEIAFVAPCTTET